MRDQYTVLHLGKFYPPYMGGMETALRDLAVRQTSRAKVEVIVANDIFSNEREVIEDVNVRRVARVGMIASMPICPGLSNAIRTTPADLIHLHTPNPGAALALLLSGHRGKLVITHHADIIGRKFLRQLSNGFVRAAMDRAEAIIVTSLRYLNSSNELTPYRDKCQIIPLGIDPMPFLGPSSQQDLPSNDPMILAVGRLVPYKGFDVLIRAMKTVDAKLILIGTGPQQLELETLSRSLSLEKKVHLLGRVENVGSYLKSASIFVMPSVTRAEAFGIVQLEAMAAGLPVINTDIDSGVPEISIHNETGLTVPPGDVNSLAQAIQKLLARPDLRREFGNSAKERVMKEFTADLMSNRTLALYENVLG